MNSEPARLRKAMSDPTALPVPEDADLLKIFRAIADAWGLNIAQRSALLRVSERTYSRWKTRLAKLTQDQRHRISYLLNIYLDLQAIHNDDEAANTWVNTPNKAYNEFTPLEVMMTGTLVDVYRVYSYVHRVTV